jgi:4-amino-4-deoxychorismate lyase
MCQLLETIKVKQGQLQNIEYHNNRLNISRKQLFSVSDNWDLSQIIDCERLNKNTTYRCRVLYNKQLHSVEFFPYTIKPLKTLSIVQMSDIDYSYKYANREVFDNIKLQYPHTDDVLIVVNGLITDCSYANVVFFDGVKWVTPSQPLLNGTKRQYYLNTHVIYPEEISLVALKRFVKMKIINAMIDFDESSEVLIENIY